MSRIVSMNFSSSFSKCHCSFPLSTSFINNRSPVYNDLIPSASALPSTSRFRTLSVSTPQSNRRYSLFPRDYSISRPLSHCVGLHQYGVVYTTLFRHHISRLYATDNVDPKGVISQGKTLVQELLARDEGKVIHHDPLFPDREVDFDIEFPNLSEKEIQRNSQNGEADPVKVAFTLRKEKVKKKIKNAKKKRLHIPPWQKNVVAVDTIPVAFTVTTEEKEEALDDEDDEDDEEIREREEALMNEIEKGDIDEGERRKFQKEKDSVPFSSLEGLDPAISEFVHNVLGFNNATEIQRLAIPLLVNEDKHVFIAAQTGTGKTLSYLLPIFQRLWKLEDNPEFRRRGQNARSIIILPTRELVMQTQSICEKLLEIKHFKHFRITALAGGLTRENKEHRLFNNGVDVLITTPDRLEIHIEKNRLSLEDTAYVVIDEADTMLTNPIPLAQLSFIMSKLLKETSRTIYSMLSNPIRFVWASATVSQGVSKYISQYFKEDTVFAVTRTLHKSVDGLRQDFLFGASGDFKRRLLFSVLSNQKGKRTMIFCNNIEHCKLVFNLLDKKGYSCTFITSETTSRKRLQAFNRFSSGEVPILVTTDLASRGIDTAAVVEHVILYDFPKTSIDYLHRVGRTARAGKKGLVSAFIAKHDQQLAMLIRDAYKEDRSLANIATPQAQGREEEKKMKEKEKRWERKEWKKQGPINPKYMKHSPRFAGKGNGKGDSESGRGGDEGNPVWEDPDEWNRVEQGKIEIGNREREIMGNGKE